MESCQTCTKDDIFRDEQGSLSSARVFLACHLVQMTAYVWVCLLADKDTNGSVLTMDAGIATALIAWAGGARIAQYIGPQIAATSSAVASSIREAVQKRRAGNDEFESTP